MSFPLPSLADIGARARQLFAESIPGAVVNVWPNMYSVTARVLALLSFEWHQRMQWLSRQIFASTADEAWLRRHAYELGIIPRPAARASGVVTVPASAAGIAIPAGVSVVASDGRAYQVKLSALSTTPTTSLTIEAIDAGAAGNIDAGVTMTFDNAAYPDLGTEATVAAGGIGGGADAEAIEELRARVLARRRNPPLGGAAPDWVRWALEVPGVSIRNGVPMVWVDRFTNDPRTVWVSFLFDGRTNGIPNSGDVAAVQAWLEDPVRRPVTADVVAVAPTAVPFNITITNLQPDDVATRAAVQAELAALFAERMEPGKPSSAFVLSRSWIGEAVSRATGEDRHQLTLPSADVVFSSGQYPVLGTVTFA